MLEEPQTPNLEREHREDHEFSVLNDLKPVEGLTDEDVDREIILTRNNAGHPLNVKDDRFHAAALRRFDLLYGKKYSPEKLQAQQEKETKAMEKQMDKRWAEIDQEKAEKEVAEIQRRLEMRLAQEGIVKPVEEAKKVIQSAQTTFRSLMQEKVLAGDFADFLEETGEGNLVENLKLFSDISKLQERYLKWKSGEGPKE